jgi:chromosome segregation ATPase
MDRQITDITSQVASLRQEKAMLDQHMDKGRKDLEDLKQLIKAREADLSGFSRREQELSLKEKLAADVTNTKQILAKKESDLKKMDELLAKKQGLLDAKEKELDDKRAKMEYELQKAEANRRLVYEEIKNKQTELADLTKLRALRNREIAEAEKLLKEKEIEMLETIRNLELDKELLDKKEDEIDSTARRIESDKLLVEQKEEEILEKISLMEELQATAPKREEEMKKIRQELDAYDKALSEKEKQLDRDYQKKLKELDKTKFQLEKTMDRLEKKEAKIAAVKELRVNITAMENKLKQLDNLIAVKESEIGSLKTEATKDVAISLEVKRMEEELEKRQKEIEEKERQLLREEAEAETGEFHEYIEHETARYAKPALPKIKEATDVYSMIDEARELINMGRLNEARAIYAKIGNIYEQLDVAPTDKKRVYYAILELKTDIELAYLA